jgi:signal transduction histidine kinase
MFQARARHERQSELSVFIRENMEEILTEWENFARTRTIAAKRWKRDVLRDHGEEILLFIAENIESPQSSREQEEKSKGRKQGKDGPESAAETHATMRLERGFNIEQVAAEYRALRASITKLWTQSHPQLNQPAYYDLIRFNEAIDQNLVESISRFAEKQSRHRALFLAILGHDMRTPLGAIMMSAQLLHKPTLSEDKERALLTQIENSSSRIKELIGNLLDLTRIHQGIGIPIDRSETDLSHLAAICLEEIKSMYPERSFDFRSKGNTQGYWDRGRLSQALSNLLSNAIQYGSPRKPITVHVRGNPLRVLVAVHNEGNPIPPGSLHDIFESFHRGTQAATSSTNLGLGLYITKEIVLAHRGKIRVLSAPHTGTTFIISLPRADEPA